MPDEPGVLFSEALADRIVTATEWVEGNDRGSIRRDGRGPAGAGINQAFVVRCTSGTADGNGNYPAVVTVWSGTAWSDYGAVKLKPINGETLVSGTRYLALPIGTPASSDPVYAVVPPGAGSVPVFSGARVFNSTDITISNTTTTALTFDSERFDTDAYHSIVSNTSRLTAPVTGYYMIGGTVAWDQDGTGIRSVGIQYNGGNVIASHDNVPDGTVPDFLQSLSTLSALTAGDWVELVVFQSTGGNLDILWGPDFSPEFWIAKVG